MAMVICRDICGIVPLVLKVSIFPLDNVTQLKHLYDLETSNHRALSSAMCPADGDPKMKTEKTNTNKITQSAA